MRILGKIKNLCVRCKTFAILLYANLLCIPIIEIIYNGFWNYRNHLIRHKKDRTSIYNAYLELNCASIGLKSIFKTAPVTPHGLHGIHISDGAIIGENITIMQNVTIGSNTLKDTKNNGAPQIGDNVFIGANSTIIGGITIGNNCRIGANCCAYTNVPDNHTVVSGGVRLIPHLGLRDNKFYPFVEYNEGNK